MDGTAAAITQLRMEIERLQNQLRDADMNFTLLNRYCGMLSSQFLAMGWFTPPPPLLWCNNSTASMRVQLHRHHTQTTEQHEAVVTEVVHDILSVFRGIKVCRYNGPPDAVYTEIVLRSIRLDAAFIDSVMLFINQRLQHYSFPPPALENEH